MMGLKEWWAEFTGARLERGVYRYDGEGELARHRFHLRVDSERKGVLIIDASSLVELNGTALEYVRCMLEGRTEQDAVKHMLRRYRNLDRDIATTHYRQIREKLIRFVHGEAGVVNIIGADAPVIGADDYPAPYRMDLILSYRCQNRCGHCYNEPRQLDELSLDQWKRVIRQLWEIGVPHIVFTGGEPTLSPYLGELVQTSEGLGQVTGLVTNGRRLAEPGYLGDLIQTGLDHVQITVLSHRPEIHDRLVGATGAWEETMNGLDVALNSDLYVSTNTTLMRSNISDAEATLRFLIARGVKNIAFNGLIRSGRGKNAEGVPLEELADVLVRLKTIADEAGVRMIWYTPTPYCELNPINLGLGIKQCTACSLSMAVEPDGTVLPCQSYYAPLGNLLIDLWEDVWDHPLCHSIRRRDHLNGSCIECGLRNTCGGGCPLARKHGDYACPEQQQR